MELNRDSVKDTVLKIVADHLGKDKNIITEESNFVEDLDADSLDTVEIVMSFEDEFEISVPDEEAEKLTTVGSVIEYICVSLRKAENYEKADPP
ncbi:acyl carrier protein [Candidatus Nomurabacteria bacterium]|nr:acyl carrier protein [Candidatus Nomurabacteria bacterium]